MTGSPHWQATVLVKRRSGRYPVLTLSAPGLADLVRPGHFASVAVTQAGLLLRRQLWITAVSGSGRDGGAIEVVVDPDEPGGRWLAGVEHGARVDVIAPLGRPFSLPRQPVQAAVVAFGTASAAVIPLAARLAERGSRVRFVLVAGYGVLDARRVAADAIDLDDPAAVRGLLATLAGDPTLDLVYSAGTAAQCRTVARALPALPHQTAVATAAVCGAGSCTACGIPVTGRDGVVRLVRACTEGPVFPADLVRWDDLGAVPAALQPEAARS